MKQKKQNEKKHSSPPIKKNKHKLKITKSINILKTNDDNSSNRFKNNDNSNYPIQAKNDLVNINITIKNNIALKKEEKKIKIDKNFMKLNDYELNNLPYKDALKSDKRAFIQFYLSLIKTKHILMFTFCPARDYNSRTIKIYLFFLSFAMYCSVNALFFNDATMHKIYEDGGAFNIIYQIPQILYSSIISSILSAFLKTLSLSESNILDIKHESNIKALDNKKKQILKCLYYKFMSFFIISFILLIFFWYYLACFCVVYKNTQTHLLKDTTISFGLSMLYPFGIYLLPGTFRIPALRAKKKNRETIYKISKIIQLI